MLDFADIKRQYPIEKVIELLGLDLTKQKNGQLRGGCPIHGGNDPRGFVVTPSTCPPMGKKQMNNCAYCFKCEEGGDALWLISKVRKISAKAAAEWLVGDVGGTEKREKVETTDDQATGGMTPLDYLDPEHEAVMATGLDPEIAALIGAGYAPKGTMRGQVLLPVRLPTGELIGYLGVEEVVEPTKWQLPDPKVVKLRPKQAS